MWSCQRETEWRSENVALVDRPCINQFCSSASSIRTQSGIGPIVDLNCRTLKTQVLIPQSAEVGLGAVNALASVVDQSATTPGPILAPAFEVVPRVFSRHANSSVWR